MSIKTQLPMGIENFSELREMNYYYIDKTGLIKELLENMGKVTLFTRPRRFGKTLNMSMLKYFFDIETDSTIFEGLEISKEKELCDRYMGRFPVISISLKSVQGGNYAKAKSMLKNAIGDEALRFRFLAQSDNLTNEDQLKYKALINVSENGIYTMPDELLESSILLLSRLLHKHYKQKAIILIDEYDVPLDKAYQSGYYDDMVDLMRGMLGQALKTNDGLNFAVLTGCLRISKESIFTGLNNFGVYTVKDAQYNRYFGFTDAEVRNLLEYYGFMDKYDSIRAWYDGYRFADLEIYCPWDVISYCHALKMNLSIRPQNYWVNTSSNDIIRKFINNAKSSTRDEVELLVNGGSVSKKIRQELTYRDLDSKIDNLWSVLLTTGYLTQAGEEGEDGITELVIPNNEIRQIYIDQIRDWFNDKTAENIHKLEDFCNAFCENNVTAIEGGFTSYLKSTISIRDTNVRKNVKENFYHGILLGLFAHMDDWRVMSNAESGEGYSDIIIEIEDKEIGIVIELKYAENAAFEDAVRTAMRQINERNYEQVLVDDGMKNIYRYGIACYKKRCKVISG